MTCKDCLKDCIRKLPREFKKHLRSKGIRYWLIAALLIIVGTFIGHELGRYDFWTETRYKLYQRFSQLATLRTPYARRTVMVLIGDDEYWHGRLARRVPIKRDYLAELLTKLDAANPEVIALDVDLSSPMPEQSSGESPDYKAETTKLLDAVKAVSRNRTVVLSTSVRYTDDRKGYIEVPNVYDEYNFEGGNVRKGYIQLPYDLRQVPLVLPLKDNRQVDSFAVAIARAVDERSLLEAQHQEKDSLPFGTFIRPESFKQYLSSDVLSADDKTLKSNVGFKIVIIGGAWYKNAYGQGAKYDGHISPVGEIDGAFIHANYVEALLSSRTYGTAGHAFNIVVDVILATILALVLSIHTKLRIKLLVIFPLWIVLAGLSIVMWQNLGLFFDFFIPGILLIGHVVVERMCD